MFSLDILIAAQEIAHPMLDECQDAPELVTPFCWVWGIGGGSFILYYSFKLISALMNKDYYDAKEYGVKLFITLLIVALFPLVLLMALVMFGKWQKD